MNGMIANELLKIAKAVQAEDYNYSYDPEHKKKPAGGGWAKTDKGWQKGKSENSGESQKKNDRETSKVEAPKSGGYTHTKANFEALKAQFPPNKVAKNSDVDLMKKVCSESFVKTNRGDGTNKRDDVLDSGLIKRKCKNIADKMTNADDAFGMGLAVRKHSMEVMKGDYQHGQTFVKSAAPIFFKKAYDLLAK